FFAEFDDQGWPFDGEAGQQIPIFIDELRRALAESENGVSIVIFVHGWKHDAAYDDSNVQSFRKVLTGLSHIENADGTGSCHRKVIGLYIGWRGRALLGGDLLENISFWDRKNIAAKVAQGSIRELFARIRSLENATNEAKASESRDSCQAQKVRSMYIGHSF